jgi:hypothetical protein
VILKIGKLQVATGADVASLSAPASVVDPVSKALPEGAIANRAGTDQIRAHAESERREAERRGGLSAAAATGERPSPGPVPVAPTEPGLGPLQYQFPYNTNQIWTPRSGERNPFTVLREFADVCDAVRICIETRKDQLCQLDWEIVPRNKSAMARGTASRVEPELAAKIARARAFFESPDRVLSFDAWLRMAIEEVLAIDALSIYRRRTVDGSELYSLEIVDGTTIKPMLDPSGRTPLPPDVAYRQVIYGRPVQGGDCTTEQMYYVPRTVRTGSPYGMAPTEAVLLKINSILNRDIFNLAYYAEGNVPDTLLSVGEASTPAQIRELQAYYDLLLSGDLARRRKLKVIGKGSTVEQLREPDWSTDFDEYLMKLVMAAFAVAPAELGFTADVNKSTSEGQENVSYRRGVRPLARFFAGLFNRVLAVDLQMPELQFRFVGGEVEDKLKQAQADEVNVRIGKESVDEIRVRDGLEPIGMSHYIASATGPILVSEFLAGTGPSGTDVDGDGRDDRRQAGVALEDSVDADGAGAPAATGSAASDDDASEETAKVAGEIRRWRTVAIKAAKRRAPAPAFRLDVIAPAAVVGLERDLQKASTVAAVVAAFDRVDVRKITVWTRELRKAERRLASLVADYFEEEGAALAAHVEASLEQ